MSPKAGILEPALFPRQRRVTHLGKDWGKAIAIQHIWLEAFRCNGTFVKGVVYPVRQENSNERTSQCSDSDQLQKSPDTVSMI
jgi:hypothetical protein